MALEVLACNILFYSVFVVFSYPGSQAFLHSKRHRAAFTDLMLRPWEEVGQNDQTNRE